MSLLDDLKMYLRFASGLREYARHRLTPEQARETIRRRMAQREANFLRFVERGIFGYAKSPYRPLMKLAGCEFADIREMVKSRGLEKTLSGLRRAGVYVSYEEFKGRTPMVRQGKTYPVTARDFENPFLKVHYQGETGGTTGVGRRVPLELDHQAEHAPQLIMALQAHGCLGAPSAVWRGPIPDATGMNYMLRAIRHGHLPQKWFITHLTGDSKPRLSYRLAGHCFVNIMRMLSVPVPRPRPLRLSQADVLARWAEKTLETHAACCIQTTVSRALWICDAAQRAGMNLSGTVFFVSGEPITRAKAKVIHNTGARYINAYGMYELGQMGLSCANPQCSDEVHLISDCFGLITHPRTLPQGETVNALNFTSLLPTAPLLMLNAEIDDHAVVEDRSCGCPLGDLGYTLHLSQISSYTKLVSGGASFMGRDVVRVLEQVLPEKLGGGPLDYQLLEEEDQAGFTRVHLVVSPRVKIEDENMVKSLFLQSLKEGPDSYSWASSLWNEGQVLQIRRMEPFTTSRGKHLSLWRRKEPRC